MALPCRMVIVCPASSRSPFTVDEAERMVILRMDAAVELRFKFPQAAAAKSVGIPSKAAAG